MNLFLVRKPTERLFELYVEGARRHCHAVVVPTVDETDRLVQAGALFLGDERDTEAMLKTLAESNPGSSVEVYSMVSSAQTSVGPVVIKEVTKDGVLPTKDLKF